MRFPIPTTTDIRTTNFQIFFTNTLTQLVKRELLMQMQPEFSSAACSGAITAIYWTYATYLSLPPL